MKKIIILSSVFLFLLEACTKDGLSDAADMQTIFFQQLSDYDIYEGSLNNLTPTTDYQLYELGSTLFTDFAEKQRLIKLPLDSQMKKIDNGLPFFPDGTIIVKTFFYFNDKRDISKGKRIIETRLLIKKDEEWNVADYLWDENQTDAILIEDGLNTTVNYIDENGQAKVLAYHVPSNRECATCHLDNDALVPIGPKMRSLNLTVETPLGLVNQITYFQNLGILNSFDLTTLSSTPDYHDISLSNDLRARAYLDINCGHCHYKDGFAADTDLLMNYETSLEASNIEQRKGDIIDNLDAGKMPYLGTSVLDEEGIKLIKEFLNSL